MHPIAAWADEAPDKVDGRRRRPDTDGHFTQLVWQATTKVGCAAAEEGGARTLVCHYAPSGNQIGRFQSWI